MKISAVPAYLRIMEIRDRWYQRVPREKHSERNVKFFFTLEKFLSHRETTDESLTRWPLFVPVVVLGCGGVRRSPFVTLNSRLTAYFRQQNECNTITSYVRRARSKTQEAARELLHNYTRFRP